MPRLRLSVEPSAGEPAAQTVPWPGREPRALSAGVALAAALGAALGVVVYASSEARIERRYAVSLPALRLPEGPAALARGRTLVRVLGQCGLCHGEDLGGAPAADEPGLGRLWAPNLTSGAGGAAGLAPADWVRAIRFGIGRDGRALWIMPAQHLRRLADEDVGAIAAYLRSVPAVDRAVPPRWIGWKTRVALFLGLAPGFIPAEDIELAAPAPAVPAAGRTVAYGEYLVALAACRVCHHESLAGGAHPLALRGEPPVPNLTPAGSLRELAERDFIAMLRSGVTPQGRALDPRRMPWPALAPLGDVELGAIWLYLRSLAPLPTGSLR